MAGTFGYELDPAKMTDEERREIRKQIVEYKKYAQLVQNGLYYRLSNPFAEEIGAWEFVSEDGKEVLVNVVMLEIHGNMTVNYVKMKGLCAGQFYKDSNTGKIYPAEALMKLEFRCRLNLVSTKHIRFIWKWSSKNEKNK